MASKPALRTELLLNLAFLAAVALLLGAVTSLLISAVAPESLLPLVLIVVALDVVIFIVFGRYLVTRLVLGPMDRLVAAADAVVAGDLAARAPDAETRDFATLGERLNRMTDYLLDARSQLVRSEKLASIGRLAAGIAHEVGNPLGAVGTYVEVLRRRGADPEVVAGLSRELDRIDTIVRSLLDYARPQQEALDLVAPGDVVRAAFELLQSQGALKAVAASLDLASDVPRIRARAHLLEQVLVNLMLNAVDAASGGAVVVGARRWAYEPGHAAPRRTSDAPGTFFSRAPIRRPVRIEIAAGAPGALLFVADAGPGVSPEDRERIFEPFYTTKAPGRGTGLGLAIVARAVDEMGGVVWVDTAREGGAAFKLFFPEIWHPALAMSKVLVVDDEPGLRQSLGLLLADAGYDVAAETDGKHALERALAEPFDLILCDVRMPELDGLSFLRAYRDRGGTALVIMMSAYGGEEAALAAMKEGAYDYIPKPFRPDEVVLTLRKAEERERLRHTVATLRAQLDTTPAARALVAESQPMRDALAIVARVAEHTTTVLITGASGTGKEVIAQAIHRASPRAAEAFVAINCAAIPESLLESELFGHVKGAFTGATADKAGLFELAHRGTLLLDEIGELPLGLQAKLLRVLQEGEIRRVGDQKTRRVDVRLLAATARDLAAEAAAGRFREDLFYRLHVVTIHIPPLRERREDIAPLAQHFAGRLSRRLGRRLALSPAALAWLEQQPWGGNVRELEHALERAAVLSDKETLEPADLTPGPPLGPHPLAPPLHGVERGKGGEVSLRDAVEAAEREAIQAALAAAGSNRRDAARRLGISLRTLFYKLQQYRLE